MTQTPEQIAASLTPATSGGERQTHSRVGHCLAESSWHVRLAGFRSRADAEAALAVLAALDKGAAT